MYDRRIEIEFRNQIYLYAKVNTRYKMVCRQVE